MDCGTPVEAYLLHLRRFSGSIPMFYFMTTAVASICNVSGVIAAYSDVCSVCSCRIPSQLVTTAKCSSVAHWLWHTYR